MTITLPQEGFAKLKTVLSVIPISRAAWYQGIKNGLYPKPVKLGGRNVAWKVGDIRAVITRLEQQNQNSTTLDNQNEQNHQTTIPTSPILRSQA